MYIFFLNLSLMETSESATGDIASQLQVDKSGFSPRRTSGASSVSGD